MGSLLVFGCWLHFLSNIVFLFFWFFVFLVFCFLFFGFCFFGKLCRTAGIANKYRNLYLIYYFSETVA